MPIMELTTNCYAPILLDLPHFELFTQELLQRTGKKCGIFFSVLAYDFQKLLEHIEFPNRCVPVTQKRREWHTRSKNQRLSMSTRI